MLNFKTASDYLAALKADPALAIVPPVMAAESVKRTRAAVARMLKLGQLAGAKIGNTSYVLAESLFERTEKQEKLIEKVQKLLEVYATKGQIVFYEPVMTVCGLRTDIPADRDAIGKILEVVSVKSYNESGILLSAIVHRKTRGRTKPGPGFFDLARALGYRWSKDARKRRVLSRPSPSRAIRRRSNSS
jgi:hypothetical protein